MMILTLLCVCTICLLACGLNIQKNFVYKRIFRPFTGTNIVLHAQKEKNFENNIPDARFSDYFAKRKNSKGLLDQDTFFQFDDVKNLLSEQLVIPSDVENLWLSSLGDAEGLNEQESFELLSMVCYLLLL